jgi:hypothetical protein
VVQTHSGVRLSCQAIQCLWLVHSVASVETALGFGEKLSPTWLIKYVMCYDSSPKTVISYMTQINNPTFLDICWLSHFYRLTNVKKYYLYTCDVSVIISKCLIIQLIILKFEKNASSISKIMSFFLGGGGIYKFSQAGELQKEEFFYLFLRNVH